MSSTKVLDTHAILTFLGNEPGADEILALLLKAEERSIKLATTSINLAEVWIVIAESEGGETANHLLKEIQGTAIEVVDVDWPIAFVAASLASKAKAPLTACVAAAVARARKADLVTGDSSLRGLEPLVKVTWIPGNPRRPRNR